MAGTSRLLNPEVFERLKTVLIYHGNNLKEHQELLKSDTADTIAVTDQPQMDRERVIKNQIGKINIPEER